MAFFSEFGNELARNSENPPNPLTHFFLFFKKYFFFETRKCKMHTMVIRVKSDAWPKLIW